MNRWAIFSVSFRGLSLMGFGAKLPNEVKKRRDQEDILLNRLKSYLNGQACRRAAAPASQPIAHLRQKSPGFESARCPAARASSLLAEYQSYTQTNNCRHMAQDSRLVLVFAMNTRPHRHV